MTAAADSIEASGVAGWYGKLPCLGDFASRRLPTDFITPWDAWLQRSIAASRRQLGDAWLDVFLTSPMWRFALAPGVCGEHAYAGLLLPSVDKVGRYFPLTLALPIPAEHTDIVALLGVQAWYAELEHVGLAALNVDYSPDALEAALADNVFPLRAPQSAPPGTRHLVECFRDPAPAAQSFHLGSIDDLAAAASAGARAMAVSSIAGKSCWWSVAQDSGATEFHYSAGLPPDDYFTVLLGGPRVAVADALPVDPLQALDAAALR